MWLGAAAVASAAALLAAAGRLRPWGPLRLAATTYVEFFRGTSALIQLFWLFFALPLAGITLPPMLVGIGGLGLCMGAYGSEIVRAAVLAVPASQVDAARALGLPPRRAFCLVILPQALAAAIPSIGNIGIELLKLTSLVSLITLRDLTFEAQTVHTLTLRTGPVFAVVLLAYYLLSRLVTLTTAALERRRNKWFAR